MRDLRSILLATGIAWLALACGGSDDSRADVDPDSGTAVHVVVDPATVVARHNESVTVRVDVPNARDADLPSGYAFDLDEVAGHIEVTTAPCPPGAGTQACQLWTITPRVDSVPGRYAIQLRTVGSRTDIASTSFDLDVVANPSPDYGAAIAVAASGYHVLVLNDAGRVYVMGEGSRAGETRVGYRRQPVPGVDFRLDEETFEPGTVTEFVEAPLPADAGRWRSIAAEYGRSYAVADNGSVWAWGDNRDSVFGYAPVGNLRRVVTPRPIPGLANVRSVAPSAGGRAASYALLDDASVRFWLDDSSRLAPLCEATRPPLHDECERHFTDVRALSVYTLRGGVGPRSPQGFSVGILLKNDGSVWESSEYDPGPIDGAPNPAVSVAVTSDPEVVAVGADGSVWIHPFLGGDPELVLGLTDVVAVSARPSPGLDEVFALRRDGTVWSWLARDPPPAGTPQQVPGLSNIVALGGHYAIGGDCYGSLWRMDRGGTSQPTRAVRVPGFGAGPGCGAQRTAELTVVIVGQGRVISAPAGIDCGSTCRTLFAHDMELRLLAAPAAGWKLERWVGDRCDSKIALAPGSHRCEAHFVPGGERRLAVRVEGDGRVTSEPAGIDCGTDCTHSYDVDTAVALTTAPALGYRFDRFIGDVDCADGALIMNGVRSCVARFTPLPEPAAPTGFTATAVANAVQLRWDAVTGPVERYGLERTNASGVFITIDQRIDGIASEFVDRTAAPATTYTYRLTAINASGASAPVTASATTLPATSARLSVAISGSGTVTSTPAGIDCTTAGGSCSAVFAASTQVVLTATPGAGHRLQMFGGDADCTDGVVIVSATLACSATFIQTTGQGWVQLGGAPLVRSGTPPASSLAVDAGNVPHVAYTAAVPLGDVTRLRVARFDGTAWQQLGDALNAGAITPASDPSLALSPAGVLHVAWSQGNGIQQNVFVARFGGASWESVGAPGIPLNYVAGSRAVGPSLGFDANGLPMVAWIEGNAVKFKRFTGVAWVPAQGLGSAEGPASNGADRVRLSSAPAGVPLIAWTGGDGSARALNVVRDFTFTPLGSRVNAPLPGGTLLADFGVLGGVPDAVATVAWAERSANGFTVRASRWDGQWIDFAPIVNASSDALAAFAMARTLPAVAYSSTSASAASSALQVALRTSGFTFDPFGAPLLGARTLVLRPLAFEMAGATRPIVAGVRVFGGDLYELHVYGYFP